MFHHCFTLLPWRGLDLRTCSKWSCTKHAWTRLRTRCDMVKALQRLAKHGKIQNVESPHGKTLQEMAGRGKTVPNPMPVRQVAFHLDNHLDSPLPNTHEAVKSFELRNFSLAMELKLLQHSSRGGPTFFDGLDMKCLCFGSTRHRHVT